MATIVNARDVLLQATTPRVATIDILPNLVVDQTQVEGLGLALANTRTIELQATSQVFQIPKTGSVTPASITLTVVKHNIAGTPTLSVISGTVTGSLALTGGAVTIPYANFTTDSATIRVTATDGSDTFTDDVTIIKVREGIDSFNGLLTNESHTLAADNLGNVLSYTGCGGTFKVYQGAVDITTLCTFSLVANPSSLTYSLNSSTGVYSITGGYPTGTDVTTITFRATLGTVTLDKVMTIAKSKAGVAGVRGSRTYYVALSGATNTYSDSLATTTVTSDGGPILNDTVTQYNNSVNFSQTKFWNGSSWVVVNAVVDGNLLVSGTVGASAISANAVTATKIAAGAVDATKISVTTLSAIQASLGSVQIDSSGYLRTNGATAYGSGNGIWMGYDSGSATYRFRVGNPSGAYLGWDGTNLVFTGDLTGATGTFSGSLNVKSATSGARTEITNSVIKVYDSGGVVRVKLGDLS